MFVKIDGTVTALAPLYQGGNEKTGSTPVLRSITIWTSKGEKNIPYLHGNSIRGRLRRPLVKDFLARIGYQIKGKSLYHSLFSGGVLENSDNTNQGVIDLELKNKIKEFIPPISLLGACFGNQMIQGCLSVGHMFPICEEYSEYLPDHLKKDERSKQPVRVFTDEEFITRRDELRERDENEQAIQMKVDYECFIPGTRFYHSFVLSYPTEIDKACFARAIELWEKHPTVGGRSSSGDGIVKLDYNIPFDSKAYLEFLDENKEEIIRLLEELDR